MELLPQYAAKVQEKFAPLIEKLAGYDREKAEALVGGVVEKMGSLPLNILQALYGIAVSAVSSVAGMLSTLFGMVVIPVATFYFLRDIDSMKDWMFNLVPERYRPKAAEIFNDIDTILSAFLRGQFTVALSMAFMYALGLYFIGTPMGLFIGILAGLSNVVPYLPLLTGFLPALVMTYLQFGDLTHLLYVIALFGAVQVIEGFLLTPRIVGESVGLHPVAIMLALLMGGMFFGIIGIVLAVPAAAVLKVLSTHALGAYRGSDFFRKNRDEDRM